MPDDTHHHLPQYAQEIYCRTLEKARQRYKALARKQTNSPACEEAAHYTAWLAVSREYEQTSDGVWIKR